MRWEKIAGAAMILSLLSLGIWIISWPKQPRLISTNERPARQARAASPFVRPSRLGLADGFAGFEDWQKNFRATPPLAQPALIATGVQLAEARQRSLAELARTQPDQAIECLLSLSELADLPEAIRTVSEQPISGTGSIDLRWAIGGSCSEEHECQHHSIAYLNGKSWRVNGPDYLTSKPPRANVPISGHLIQGELLVSSSPVRKLSGKNLAAGRKLFEIGNLDAKDPVTGNLAQPEIAALIGGKIYQFENEANIDQVTEVIAQADFQADKDRSYTVNYPYEFLAASGGTDPVSAGSPVLATPFQADNIRVLFLRVDFSDKPGEPVSVANLQASLATTNTRLQNYSYGVASLIPTVATQLYRLPNPSTTYTTSATGSDDLHQAARSLAAANYTLANYDVVAVNFTRLSGPYFDYFAGLGSLGGGYQWINGLTSNTSRVNVMTHEFGHNYGLHHSNYFDPAQQIPGTYKTPGSLEYGDIFDTMGDSYSSSGYFSPYSTSRLNWMPSAKVQQVTGNGTWRVHRFDDPAATANPLLALRIPLGGNEYWWVGMRQLGTGTANSAYVVAEGIVPIKPNLIDMTPGSFPLNETKDRSDAALPVLGNFYDPARGVRIRNLASGGIAPNEWIDVSVEFDSQVQLATTNVEVDEQADSAVLTLKRTFSSNGVASVNYATASGTAISGSDFLPLSGTVTWADGDLADKQILVPIRPDTIADGGETFTLTLSGASGAILVPSQSEATITIREAGQQLSSFKTDYFGNVVKAIARLADGKLLIGGAIQTGLGAGNFARLNANGSLDESFLKGSGFNGEITTLVVQADDKILCGGDFTSYNGAACNRIARLNSDGSLDTAFITASGTGLPAIVYAIALEASGKILVGGYFTSFDGMAAAGIVRLTSSGARDSASPLTLPFNSAYPYINSILAQADGKIMVVGAFNMPTTSSNFRAGIARLNADGTRDISFDPVAGLHAAGNTYDMRIAKAIVRQPDGKYILAGDFTAYDRNTVSGVVRIYANGRYDSSFVTPVFSSGSSFFSSPSTSFVHLQPNGNILVGGNFTSPTNGLAMLQPNGANHPSFSVGTGPSGPLTSIAADTDGSFWVGGNFYSYNGISCWPIVKVAGGVSSYDIWLAAQNLTIPIAEPPVVEPPIVVPPIVVPPIVVPPIVVPPADVTFTLTVKAYTSKLGKVTGSGTYKIGSRVTLVAQPKRGRKFVGWFENRKRISKNKVLIISNLMANRFIIARFQ